MSSCSDPRNFLMVKAKKLFLQANNSKKIAINLSIISFLFRFFYTLFLKWLYSLMLSCPGPRNFLMAKKLFLQTKNSK